MEATAIGLGMDLEGEEWKGLRENVENSFWVMRTIGYPPLPQDAPGVSCGAHKGKHCISGSGDKLLMESDDRLWTVDPVTRRRDSRSPPSLPPRHRWRM
jgi:hypothetical protein